MPLAEFEPTIPVSERSQTHALDRAATGISKKYLLTNKLEDKITYNHKRNIAKREVRRMQRQSWNEYVS
jgi:hypothetical protein